MSIRYLDLSGAVNFWTNIKNYILSKIPTKTSELTNDSGFLTQHQSLSNYVTLNSEQTIAGKKLFTNSTTKVNSVNTFTGSTQFIDLSTTVPRGAWPAEGHRVGRVYIGDNTSYNGAWFIVDPTITSTKAYYRVVTTNPDNTDSTRFSITWDSTKEGARRRRNVSMGDLICATNNTYQIGESGNVWKDVYATNYYYGADAVEFSTKFVTSDTAQTITGAKTFSSTITGSISGNASTATEFSANKDVTLTGDVTGTASSKAGWSVSTTLSNSGVTAGTYGPSADVTGSNNATILVPEITVDAKGRVTSVTNRTYTSVNTDNDKKVYQYYKSDDNVYRLLFSNNAGNTATSNVGAVYSGLNNSFYVNPSTGSLYATKLYSGGTEVKVTSYDSHIADTDIHVTAADKTKWNNGVSQAYVLRYSSASVTDNSTIAFSTLDNTDNIKSGDKVIDVDGKIFSIVSVDTANQTVTVGTAIVDLALDANVVHTSGNENVGGIKTFSNNTYITSLNFTNEVESQSSSSSAIFPIITTVTYTDQSPSQSARLNLRITASGDKSLYPHENNQYALGLTTRKWSEVHAATYYYGSSDVEFSTKFVTTDTAQTIGGIKTFSDIPIFTSFDGIRFRCAHNSNAYVTFRNVGQADAGSIILSAHDGTTGTSVHLVNKTFVPYNNNDTDLGSSSKSWKDSYAYHGYFKGQQQNDEYSGNARTNLTLLANRDTVGTSGCLIDSFRENTTQGTGSHIIGFGIRENSVRYEGCRFSWLWDNNLGGYRFAFRPTLQGTNQAVEHNLGTSTDKWATINGLEPSSLSMPDLANGIDISSYIDVTQTSQYTAPANGYIAICGYASSTNAILIKDHDYDFAMTARAMSTNLGQAATYLTIPVVKNHVYDITCNAVTTLSYAKFYPCQGNV